MTTVRDTSAARVGLVLSGGGARAAYQVGVLRALSERAPALAFPIITGVSAGAINALYLAAHSGSFAAAAAALRREWSGLHAHDVFQVRPAHLAWAGLRWLFDVVLRRRAAGPAVRGLLDMGPLREFLGPRLDLHGVQGNLAAGRLRAVALSATSYSTGDTVTFVQGADDVPVWERARRRAVRTTLTVDHVLASSAIPVLFPAVRLGAAFYGDGSVRQTAPLAPAIHLGARVLVAIAMRPRRSGAGRSAPPEYPSAAHTLGVVLDSIFLESLDADAERLERINGLLAGRPRESIPADGLRTVQLLMLHPSQDLGALASGLTDTLPRSLRLIVESLGGHRIAASDFLSYVLFEPEYTSRLMELGYRDVERDWPQIAAFMERARL
jgi:NTE family protein